MTKRTSPLLQSTRALAANLSAVLLLLLPEGSAAQSSPPYYINREHRFAVIFPGEPTATDVAYATGSGTTVRARQFSLERGGDSHVVTVVDFSAGPAVDADIVEHAAEQLRRKGEVRFQYADEYDPGIPGRQLNIFQGDGRQIRASIYMWDHRLYIAEASGAPGSSTVLQFEQSIMLLDGDGNELNLDAAAFGGP
jgi:hypothetical protein